MSECQCHHATSMHTPDGCMAKVKVGNNLDFCPCTVTAEELG